MAAIQIRPSTSWRHLPYFGVTNGSLSVVMLFSVFSKQASVKRIHPDASQKGKVATADWRPVVAIWHTFLSTLRYTSEEH